MFENTCKFNPKEQLYKVTFNFQTIKSKRFTIHILSLNFAKTGKLD